VFDTSSVLCESW